MRKLIIMTGLPRAGKSSFARRIGYPIVSADAIQYAMCGKHMKPLYDFYEMSDTFAQYMIKSLFLAGHRIVTYDGCNHTVERRKYWINWCQKNNYEFDIKYINTSMEICQERAKGFKNADWLIPRIEEMAFEAEWPEMK